NVAGDRGKSRQRPEGDAARTIVGYLREVKLEEPHFPCKIEGLRDARVQRAGDADRLAGDLHAGRLAGMKEGDVAGGPPAHLVLAQPQAREEVLHHALQVEEVDGGPAALGAPRRPGTAEQPGDGAPLADGALTIAPEARPELEGSDEAGPVGAVQPRRARQARKGRAAQLAQLGRERVRE